ncbi:MAG: outer membrane protein assembly factor BamD [Longimicrobiales bacterium]
MTLKTLIPGLAIALACAACATRGPRLETMTADQLFERGSTALNNRKWTVAAESFERFTLQFPTHPRVQEARYRLGEAFYGKKEFLSSATEFTRLASDFPAGQFADDARFRVCDSYARLAPKPQLDPQYTRAAFDHCQVFEQLYPNSEFVPRAQELTLQMMNRLADKEYRAGEHYYKRRAYDSAIMYFESTLRLFPTSVSAPRSLLRLFQTYSTLGYKEEADAAKARLLKDYPESEAAREIQAITVARTT